MVNLSNDVGDGKSSTPLVQQTFAFTGFGRSSSREFFVVLKKTLPSHFLRSLQKHLITWCICWWPKITLNQHPPVCIELLDHQVFYITFLYILLYLHPICLFFCSFLFWRNRFSESGEHEYNWEHLQCNRHCKTQEGLLHCVNTVEPKGSHFISL